MQIHSNAIEVDCHRTRLAIFIKRNFLTAKNIFYYEKFLKIIKKHKCFHKYHQISLKCTITLDIRCVSMHTFRYSAIKSWPAWHLWLKSWLLLTFLLAIIIIKLIISVPQVILIVIPCNDFVMCCEMF